MNETGPIALETAARKDLGACVDILMDSILGEVYFTRDVAEPILSEAIGKKELTVARAKSGEVLGFHRLVLDGVFLVFAYIHLIAVKTGNRGLGIGTKLLEDAEERYRESAAIPTSRNPSSSWARATGGPSASTKARATGEYAHWKTSSRKAIPNS